MTVGIVGDIPEEGAIMSIGNESFYVIICTKSALPVTVLHPTDARQSLQFISSGAALVYMAKHNLPTGDYWPVEIRA